MRRPTHHQEITISLRASHDSSIGARLLPRLRNHRAGWSIIIELPPYIQVSNAPAERRAGASSLVQTDRGSVAVQLQDADDLALNLVRFLVVIDRLVQGRLNGV